MSVTLQARVDGGAPETGTVTATVGQTIQPTAAAMGTWGSPVATWSIYDFPVGFAAPAGWTYDATAESYDWSGNSNPPTFDPDPWGAYMLRVTAFEAGVSITDKLKVSVLSPSGLSDHGRDEGALDGGENKRWVGPFQTNLRITENALAGVTLDNNLSAPGALMPNRVNRLSGTATAVTLPAIDTWRGQSVIVKKLNLAGDVTVTPNGAETIDGGATSTIAGARASASFRAPMTGTDIEILSV